MIRRSLLLILPAAGIILSPVYAQQADTTQAADTVDVAVFSWVSRLVPVMQEAPKPYLLHLIWDEWGHSDLVATAANPFVPADLQVGTARLDGSLGQPIFSAIIPSAVAEFDDTYEPGGLGSSYESTPFPDLPTFIVAPLQDRLRASQTYFFWDQGDYSYQDVQVGGAVQLDESRNIMITGQTRHHPGQFSLAGPSRSSDKYKGSVLQNYLLDYRRRIRSSLDFNYTLLHQQEQVGLPFLDSLFVDGELVDTDLNADRRRNHTWAQGFRLEKLFSSMSIRLNGSSMVSDLRTTTDGRDQAHLNRRSLSLWGGGGLAYRLTPQWDLVGRWQMKQRHIADDSLGYHPLSRNHVHLGAKWTRGYLSMGGGLSVINGRLAPEGQLTIGSHRRSIALATEATSFFDYPHLGRRNTPPEDTTAWLPGPVFLRRTTLAFQISGDRGHASARLAQLSTGDDRTAITGGMALDWIPWKDVLRFRGTLTAVSSPVAAIIFPTRINAQAGLNFTLPLRRARARPFVSLNTGYIHNDFAWWNDPRFTDMVSLGPAYGNTTSRTSWLNLEGGIEVTNFELRFRVFNVTGSTIQNSPYSIYLESGPLRHYSLSWRFLPEGKRTSDAD